MKNLSLIVLFLGVILSSNSAAIYSQSPQVDLRRINPQQFKTKFVGKYCGRNKESSLCKRQWKNFSELVGFIKSDTRLTNIDIAAFILTTAAVETGCVNFAPTVEGCGHLNPEKMYKPGDSITKNYWVKDNASGKAYYGRGWIQLTWKDNYEKAGRELNLDLVNNPELVLQPKNAYEIAYLALTEGWLEFYRGTTPSTASEDKVKITDFFIGENASFDYLQARAVINARCAVGCRKIVNGKPAGWKNGIMRNIKSTNYLPYSKHLDAIQRMDDFPFFVRTIRQSITN